MLEDAPDEGADADAGGVAWAAGRLAFVRHVDDATRGVLGAKRRREEEGADAQAARGAGPDAARR